MPKKQNTACPICKKSLKTTAFEKEQREVTTEKACPHCGFIKWSRRVRVFPKDKEDIYEERLSPVQQQRIVY